MCTSIIYNGSHTLVGWNLDILDMEHRVTATSRGVHIEINDKTQGWMPLFGVNCRGEFVAMPTCWPYDPKSDPSHGSVNIINLDMDLLTGKSTFQETRTRVEHTPVCSIPGVTFQAQLSDREGNVLQITPGQGYTYLQRPRYAVMTNFSPYKGDREKHPWMGMDRFQTATQMLENADDAFDVPACFSILEATAQMVCPTVVSMVYDGAEHMVYWCQNREWGKKQRQQLDDCFQNEDGREQHGL